MYREHFSLNEPPFTITPNTHYFYKLQSHQAAFNVLMIHLRNGEGFLKITGKVGSGKTLLCRLLLEKLGDNFFIAYIPNPDLEASALRKSVAMELGVPKENLDDQHKLLSSINERLVQLHSEGKRVVLVIDEAQALPTESLETLRLFTNLETQTTKLLQIVLFGQSELDVRLNQKSLRQLKQRICFSHKLSLLKYAELNAYLQHRLTMAGYRGPEPLFTFSARLYLFYKSRGVPRLINILCHKALMCAFGRGKIKVTLSDMMASVKDTESVTKIKIPMMIGLTLATVVGFALFYWRI